MRQNSSISINPIVAVAVFLQIIFMIFAGVSIGRILSVESKSPKIKVDDYSAMNDVINTTEVSGLPSEIGDTEKSSIEGTLYQTVLMNNIDRNIKDYGAKIREGSITSRYIDYFGMYFANFIVDLEDLGQSYRVIYRDVIDEPSYLNLTDIPMTLVYCPRERDLIYGDFDCKDEYDGNGEAKVIYETLSQTMFDDVVIFMEGSFWAGEPLTFKVSPKQDDQAIGEEGVRQLAEYLSSLGFSLDDYEYKIEFGRPIE